MSRTLMLLLGAIFFTIFVVTAVLGIVWWRNRKYGRSGGETWLARANTYATASPAAC